MKRVGNTLYVQTQGSYLRLAHDTVQVELPEDQGKVSIPLHHLDSIVAFGNVLLSPFLIHRCADDGRPVMWMSRAGRFKGRLVTPGGGNVLLRQAQYRAVDDPHVQSDLAARFVAGKLQNARSLMLRSARDLRVDAADGVRSAAGRLERLIRKLSAAHDVDEVRGVEGAAGNLYWQTFGAMIKSDDAAFEFRGRSRRPPEDRVNAVLSFLYSMLANDCASACESVGLDPQAGYLHALRPGRASLGLDLMEELRSPVVDRLALRLVNRGQVRASHFDLRPGGAVEMTEDGRKRVVDAYQRRKHDEVRHGMLKTKIPIGLVPHWQATILARVLRGDLGHYRPWLAQS